MLGDVARARIRASTFASTTARSSRSGARVARASGASEDDRGPKPRVARARADVASRVHDSTTTAPSDRRPSTSTSASSTTTTTRAARRRKSRLDRALRLRDLRLRVEPLVDALESACERDEIRAAQKIKSEIADRVGDDDLVRAICRRAPGVALGVLRADALAGRVRRSPSIRRLTDARSNLGDGRIVRIRRRGVGSKTEDALAYLETLSRD